MKYFLSLILVSLTLTWISLDRHLHFMKLLGTERMWHTYMQQCTNGCETNEMFYFMFKIRNNAIVTLHSIFKFYLGLIYVFPLIIFSISTRTKVCLFLLHHCINAYLKYMYVIFRRCVITILDILEVYALCYQ